MFPLFSDDDDDDDDDDDEFLTGLRRPAKPHRVELPHDDDDVVEYDDSLCPRKWILTSSQATHGRW